MKIERVDLFPLNLPFVGSLRIARGVAGSSDQRAPHVCVKLTADDGTVGWGEARPSHRWSYETEESVVTTLRGYIAPLLVGMDPFDLDAIHTQMDEIIAPGATHGQPIAKSAVDIAVHDLVARATGVGLRQMFGANRKSELDYTWIVGASNIDDAVSRTEEGLEKGFKIKVGLSPKSDAEVVKKIAETAGDAFLWADANQAYTLSQAQELAKRFADVGVQVLEQPLAVHDITGYRRLVATSPVPIAVDESIWSPADLIQWIKLDALDMLVVKVCKMGGIRGARRSIEIAQEAGIGLLGSGLTESTLGFLASSHLYAAYGFDRPVDLNGPTQFLGDGPRMGDLELANGRCVLPDGPGLGIEFTDEILAPFVDEPFLGQQYSVETIALKMIATEK